MRLSQQLGAAVAEWIARGGSTPGPLRVAAGDRVLELDQEVVSELGVRGRCLRYSSGKRFGSEADLRAWLDQLISRLTYLTEPIALLELDGEACDALLRSQPPLVRSGARAYFEGRVNRSGEFTLLRKVFDEATRQSQVVPFQMTLEVLQHLADDLEQTTQELEPGVETP
jgi:hypothetical protein